jgi:hypothetical protein
MSSAFQLNSQRQVSLASHTTSLSFTAPSLLCCLPQRKDQDGTQNVPLQRTNSLVFHRPNKERVAILPARPRHWTDAQMSPHESCNDDADLPPCHARTGSSCPWCPGKREMVFRCICNTGNQDGQIRLGLKHRRSRIRGRLLLKSPAVPTRSLYNL